jgi:NADH:ubiquinone oxidoreductase subunit 4 (subunit M)
MPLIILTTFSTVLVIGAGWEVIQKRPAHYMAAFLMINIKLCNPSALFNKLHQVC